MKQLSAFLLALLPSVLLAASEPDYRIVLQSGTLLPAEGIATADVQADPGEVIHGGFIRLLQFYDIPSTEAQAEMRSSGISLLYYLPNRTFVSFLPLGCSTERLGALGVRSVLRLAPYQKISINLADEIPSYAQPVKGMADLRVEYYSVLAPDQAGQLAARAGTVLDHQVANHLITLRIPEDKVRELAALPWVYYVESVPAPSIPDDTKGRSLHRSNVINADAPMGRHFNGAGVAVSLADDGIIGPHIDFTGRVIQHTSQNVGTHGDMTGGILTGAGNLNPVIRGMADGAEVHVWYYNGYPQMVNAVNYRNTYGTVITSTSYSQGCNQYTTDSQSGDQTAHDNPDLLFVFSAGNNATGASYPYSQCNYGAGLPWGTITGGYKMGKNTITCANIDASEVRDNTSSMGPASDGRIKPEIASNGRDQISLEPNNTYQSAATAVFNGTSGACPGVAGNSAQLIQAYREINSATVAPTALIKAVLLNGAEDIGNAGPDYTFGFGRVNALRSVRMLEEHTYFHDSLSQGGVNNHVINVPPGVAQLRVLVYWHDPGASPAASHALVNDIDMVVTDPSATGWNPWVLDPTPNAANLSAPAVRGADHLNNMEQVTLDNPASGSYSVTLTGSTIPFGPQEYYLVYQFILDDITVTYPIGGEGFVPGTTEEIRWDALRNATPFDLEYSTDSGATWMGIALGVSGNLQQYSWTVPNTVSDQALVRISRGAVSGTSAGTFTILGVPNGITVNWCCPDSIKLSWNAVTGATGYEVSMLGTMYMDSVGTSATTSLVVHNLNPNNTYWFSVRALLPGGKGLRAYAIVKNPGLTNCPLAVDAALQQVVSPAAGNVPDCQALSVPVSVRITNPGASAVSNFPLAYSINGGVSVNDTYSGTVNPGQTVNFTFSTPAVLTGPGANTVTVWTSVAGDLNVYNDTLNFITNVIPGSSVSFPYSEDFETFTNCSTSPDCEATSCALSNGWRQDSNGVEDDIDFRTNQGSTPSGSTGPPADHTFGNSTGHYIYLESTQCSNRSAVLVSPCVSLAGIAQPQLSFWYHMYGSTMGSLHVDVLHNGTWENDVAPVLSGNRGNSWQQRQVSLTAYSGQVINVRFRATTGNGNTSDLALDDILIDQATGLIEPQRSGLLSVYPNPAREQVTFSVARPGNYRVEVLDMNGRVVKRAAITEGHASSSTVDVSGLASGIYTVLVKGTETYRTRLTVL